MTICRRTMLRAGLGITLSLGLGLSKTLAQTSDDATKVTALVEAFRVAMLKGDGGALEQLCADQMSYGHSAGRIETKAQFIAASTSGKLLGRLSIRSCKHDMILQASRFEP